MLTLQIDDVRSREVPELEDLEFVRNRHKNANAAEPTFLLHPTTLNDFIAHLPDRIAVEPIANGLLGPGVRVAGFFTIYADDSVDVGVIETVRERL